MNYKNHKITNRGFIHVLENKEGMNHRYVIKPNQSIEKYKSEIEADPDFEKYRTQENADAYEQQLKELEPTPEEIEEREERRQREIDKVEFPKLREKKLVQLLGDQIEIEGEYEEKAFAEVYPDWEDVIGKTVNAGFRFTYGGRIMRTVKDTHTFQSDWKPDEVSSEYAYVRDAGQEIPLWSDFESHEFGSMELGTPVIDEGTTYYLTNPGQGHRKPSGQYGHFGWSENNS
jgi:hypothetical protein